MSCTSDGLRCGPDLENGPRIGEQAEYPGRNHAQTIQLSDFSTGARPRLRRSPRHSVGICNKLHSFNGLAGPLFEQGSLATEDNQDIGIGIGIGPVREVGMKVAIFGASGATGLLLTQRCLDAGYAVTALLRSPDRFPLRERVRVE